MSYRLGRIRNEFGTVARLRILVLMVGLVGMPVFGYFGFASILPGIIVVVGILLGWLLRRKTVEHFEWFAWAMPVALFSYGIILFLGDKLFGLSKISQLIVITAVTVVVFNVQFWSFSDHSIINTER